MGRSSSFGPDENADSIVAFRACRVRPSKAPFWESCGE